MKTNNELSLEKQNEFVFKATALLEIETLNLQFVNTSKLGEKLEIKVLVVFYYGELKKYVDILENYKENKKICAFFEVYNKKKEAIMQKVKELSTKDVLDEIDKNSDELNALLEQYIEKKVRRYKEMQNANGNKEIEPESIMHEVMEAIENIDMNKDAESAPKHIKAHSISFLITFFVDLLVTSILLFSLSGIISWVTWENNPLKLLFFVLYFSTIETILKYITSKFFFKLYVQTFGLLVLIPCGLSILICIMFPIFVNIDSIGLFILTCILVFLIRKFIFSYVIEKIIAKQGKKGK